MLAERRSGDRRSLQKFSYLLECGPAVVRALADALCGSENLPGRTAHEAGPDEHGDLHREPCSLSRSSLRRVRRPRAGSSQDSQRRSEVHPEESRGRPAAPRYYLSQEDGLPDSSAILVPRRARQTAVLDADGSRWSDSYLP